MERGAADLKGSAPCRRPPLHVRYALIPLPYIVRSVLYAVCCMRSYVVYALFFDLNIVSKLFEKSFQNCDENHARIIPKSYENHQKSIQNGVLEGSWAIRGPFREARRPRDRFLIDFGVHFGRHFGAEIHENR